MLSTVKSICLQRYVISLTQQQIRLVELEIPCVQPSFFLPPRPVEILSEWKKETLALCQGPLANTIAYHRPAVDRKDHMPSVSQVHCRPCRTHAGTARLCDPGQTYGSLEERRHAESSKLRGQLCVQTTNIKSQQAETTGRSVT